MSPARPAVYTNPDPALPGPVDAYLKQKGIRPYCHQTEVLQRTRQGRNVVLVTATASGKSLAFALPVLEALIEDPQATALFFYPMKALAYDQLKTFKSFDRDIGIDSRPAVYDGDTPQSQRADIRSSARILLSNPHAFHHYLSWHHIWRRFLSNLKYIIIDEAHWYRGILGSNVAFLIRRMRRILHHYGADPQFIVASATMADPAAHGYNLTGCNFDVVKRDGSARPKKTYVFWNASRIDYPEHIQTANLFAACVNAGLQTICFNTSRRMAELTAKWAGKHAKDIAPYRAGYLAEERRRIEKQLQDGELRGIASTNALELGIDVGTLDAVVTAGWPGTVASFRQQVGRPGRAGQEALAVQVFYANPLDTYLLNHPDDIFKASSEQAVISLDNKLLLKNHLTCAANELPLVAEDGQYFGSAYVDGVRSLIEEDRLVKDPDTWHYPNAESHITKKYVYPGKSPSFKFGLSAFRRGSIELLHGDKILEIMTLEEACRNAHPGAIHLHRSEPYEVVKFDLENNQIHVEPTSSEFYTTARIHTNVTPYRLLGSRQHQDLALSLVKVNVAQRTHGYLLRKHNEIVGKVELEDMPYISYQTTAMWIQLLSVPHVSDLAGGLHAAEHALIAVTPLVAMCDRWDIGGMSTIKDKQGHPAIYVYDGFHGGAGIANRIYDQFSDLSSRALSLVSDCSCKHGCPKCILSPKCGSNNEPLDKKSAIALLSHVSSLQANLLKSS